MTEVGNLSQQERMQHVLRMLETRDAVHVSELSKEFSVSEVTVRSDLSELARRGLVARVRGGVRPLERGQSELGFEFRLRLEVERKQAIAKAAAAMVEEGEAVALDSSTTAYYLALELRSKKELVVVTNGLLIAAALADAPGISVLVSGGMLRLHAMSLVGDLGAEAIRATRISKGFLGARGLSIDGGLMDLNPERSASSARSRTSASASSASSTRRSGTARRCSRSSTPRRCTRSSPTRAPRRPRSRLGGRAA